MPISAPEILTAEHDVSSFDCGQPSLNTWLKARALTNQQKGFTAVVVVHEEGRVVGFYGLAPTGVGPSITPKRLRTGQAPSPLPCFLLGQPATDVAYAGRGIGTGLLAHALERSVLSARLTGGRAVIVRAIDHDAAAFWRRRGFLPSPSEPLLLFRSLPDIEASLRPAGRL